MEKMKCVYCETELPDDHTHVVCSSCVDKRNAAGIVLSNGKSESSGSVALDTLVSLCAIDYIKKDKEKKVARIKRNEIREEHACAEQSNPCHLTGNNFEDWCEGCKTVQPYYLDYMNKVRAAVGARLKLNAIVRRASS